MTRTLVATWSNGLFDLADSADHTFVGRSVGALTRSRSGRILGLVDRHTLVERVTTGKWLDVARSQRPLSCVVCVGEDIFVGTDDAAILKLSSARELESLDGFATIEGRERWYAGTAVINGEEVGPPLGVRSMTVTCDESALLANVHVGGIARSTDRGASWSPTIEIEYDIHEVSAHPARPGDVIAAAAVGLCVSRDGGQSWKLDVDGLHATYCSAATYCEDTIFVAASEHLLAPRRALSKNARQGYFAGARFGRVAELARRDRRHRVHRRSWIEDRDCRSRRPCL